MKPSLSTLLRLVRPGWIDLCGVVCSGAYLWLALLSQAPPVTLSSFYAVMGLAWSATLIAHHRLVRLRHPIPTVRIALWCCVFRAIGFTANPVLEDDPARYLWDGRSTAVYGTPYGEAPAAHFSDTDLPSRFEAILDEINNPDVPTLYGPACQLLFVAAYWIAPGELAPLKFLLLLAEGLTLFLLLGLVPRRHFLLLAWCPLAIQEISFNAHVDALGIFFVVASMRAFLARRDFTLAIAGALAVASKAFALVILPFLLLRLRGWALLVFPAVLGLLYAPLLIHSAGEGVGLATMAGQWEFNSSIYALLAIKTTPQWARSICLGGYLVFYLAVLTRDLGYWGSQHPGTPTAPSNRHLPPGEILMGVLLLLSPVANPWYLLWMLPFVAMRPSVWGYAALAAVSLSYCHGLYLPDPGLPAYHHPSWVRPAELAIIALALAFEHRRKFGDLCLRFRRPDTAHA